MQDFEAESPKHPKIQFGTHPVPLINVSELDGDQNPITVFELGSIAQAKILRKQKVTDGTDCHVRQEIPYFDPKKESTIVHVEAWVAEWLLRHYGPGGGVKRNTLALASEDNIKEYTEKHALNKKGMLPAPGVNNLQPHEILRSTDVIAKALPSESWSVDRIKTFADKNRFDINEELCLDEEGKVSREKLAKYVKSLAITALKRNESLDYTV